MTAAPRIVGDLPTASKQALRLSTTLANRASLQPLIKRDVERLCTHAQCWLVLLRTDGTLVPVPTKWGSYDCSPEQYSEHRLQMNATEGAFRIGRWAAPVGPHDPAVTCVRDFCKAHGILPRETFRVLVANDVAVQPQVPKSDKDEVIADLILAVLPHLGKAQQARVADAARRF